MVIGTDCTGSCKSNYHTIATTTVHSLKGPEFLMPYVSVELSELVVYFLDPDHHNLDFPFIIILNI